MSRLNAHGFTLIESLVALVVLSVGLLGAAAMLLGSLSSQAQALRHAAAVNLVRDVADRVLVTRAAGTEFTDALAMTDRAYFEEAARRRFPRRAPEADIHFEPAIGAATPDRYVISLRFPRLESGATDEVALTVLAFTPVAGGA